MSAKNALMLCGMLPAFEIFLTQWETLASKNQHLKQINNIGCTWATKHYSRMDLSKSYIIAMGKCHP
jgi:hypothetical protein